MMGLASKACLLMELQDDISVNISRDINLGLERMRLVLDESKLGKMLLIPLSLFINEKGTFNGGKCSLKLLVIIFYEMLEFGYYCEKAKLNRNYEES